AVVDGLPAEPVRPLRRAPPDPALPLPAGARLRRRGPLGPDPLRPPARRPDRRAVRLRAAVARASVLALLAGCLPARGDDDARVGRSRDDVRPVSLLCPPGGDRARSTIRGVMEGHSVISPDVLARYAADAAAEVPGVHTKQRRGARVTDSEVEVHVVVGYGADLPPVAAAG